MDKAREIDKKLEEIKSLIKSADKTGYSQHFKMLEALISEADYLVYNFHLSPEELKHDFESHAQSRKIAEAVFKKYNISQRSHDER